MYASYHISKLNKSYSEFSDGESPHLIVQVLRTTIGFSSLHVFTTPPLSLMLCELEDRKSCIFDVFKEFALSLNRQAIVNKPIIKYKVLCSHHELPFKFSAMFSAQPPK